MTNVLKWLILLFSAASIAFMGLSVYFAYLEKTIPAILSVTVGLLFMSSSLSIVRLFEENRQ